jgi:hypothetical protein
MGRHARPVVGIFELLDVARPSGDVTPMPDLSPKTPYVNALPLAAGADSPGGATRRVPTSNRQIHGIAATHPFALVEGASYLTVRRAEG